MKKLNVFISETLKQIDEKNLHYLSFRPAMKLSEIDAEKSKEAINSNLNGFMKETTYKKEKIKLSDLKPTQKELQISKALKICFDDYLVNGVPSSMSLIVSNDNYIIDGHHRWCAGAICNPNHEVECYKVDLNANHLISVLNILCKGHGIEGNKGRGNILNLNKKFVSKMIEHGKLGVALKKIGVDKLNELSDKLNLDNIEQICCKPLEGALNRVDMPRVDDDNVELFLDMLVSGSIDFSKL